MKLRKFLTGLLLALVGFGMVSGDLQARNPRGTAVGPVTPPFTSTHPFPHFGVDAQDGNQLPTSSTLNQLAQYPYIVLGGNIDSFVTPPRLTRSQVVNGLKGQTLTGKNAVLPIVVQYENLNEINASSPWATEWLNIVNANNWWLYNSGSSGTKTPSQFNTSWQLVNMSHNVAKDSSTGLYPYQWAAKYLYNRYITGGGLATLTNAANMTAPNLDGIEIDNLTVVLLQANNADWLRIGSGQSSTDATAIASVTAGKADIATYFATLGATQFMAANSTYAYNTVSTGQGGLGLNGANINGKFAYPEQQTLYGNATGLPNAAFNWGGPSAATLFTTAQAGSALAGTTGVISSGFKSSDYGPMRVAMVQNMIVTNGYLIVGVSTNGDDDLIDGSNPATFPLVDEMWGGQLATGGYLGAALSSSLGQVQTSAWSNGVWRRDFQNGIALENQTGSTQTVSLGGTFYHLRSAYGSQSINNAASATSVTLAAGDACVLMNNPT